MHLPGIEKPLNGLTQLISAGHSPEMHIWEPDPNATNATGTEKMFQTAVAASGPTLPLATITTAATDLAAPAGH